MIKIVVGRDRPTFDQVLAVATGGSFPSGHAMNSTIVYGTLFALSALAWSRPVRRRVATAASALVAAIAASRVYLGVHYPSDVVVGVLLGLVWLAVVVIPLRHLTERDGQIAIGPARRSGDRPIRTEHA
jgi:undecaprenyl-diphosphatase